MANITVYINGVDWTSRIKPGAKINKKFDAETFDFEVTCLKSDLDFTPSKCPPVIIYDDDDMLLIVFEK